MGPITADLLHNVRDICDLANRYIRQYSLQVEPHRLELLAAPMDDISNSPVPRSQSEEDTYADLCWNIESGVHRTDGQSTGVTQHH